MMSAANGNGRRRDRNTPADLTLPPPSFDEFKVMNGDSEGSIMHTDYEIYTFRMPCGVPIKSLDGIVLNLNDLDKSSTFEANGKEYKISSGDASENESFRLLVPDTEQGPKKKSNNSDSDDDSSDEEEATPGQPQYLKALKTPFAGHFNVLLSTEALTEQKLAPTAAKAPEPAEGLMRHAYAHVPQRKGLKRRWMPMGGRNGHPTTTPHQSDLGEKDDKDEPLAKKMKIETPKSSKKEQKKLKKEEKKSAKKEKKSAKKKKKEKKDD